MDIKTFLNVPTVFEFNGHPYPPIKQQLEYALDIKKISGYNMEFGVWQGRTINDMAKYKPEERFWGFDSFQGLPETWAFNKNFTVSKDHFKLNKLPNVENNVELVPGWFDKTLPKWLDTHKMNVSLLHVDSDLYSSAIYILEKLNSKIIPGTIIVFDELCDFRLVQNPGTKRHSHSIVKVYENWRDGEWKALNEWIIKYDRKILPISRTYNTASAIEIIK